VVAELALLGVDLDKVTATLEIEGVQKFEKSWHDLLATVTAGLQRVGASKSTEESLL